MEPYGIDLRTRVVEAHENKEGSVRELAERFAVAPNTVQNYITLYRATGSVKPRAHGGGVAPAIGEDMQPRLLDLLDTMPDATEEELAEAFAKRHSIAVSGSTIGRTLRRLGITRKKNAPRSRARAARRDGRSQEVRTGGRLDPAKATRVRR